MIPTTETGAASAATSRTSANRPRGIVFRTRGRRHGPIVRLVDPSDVGERIKPFVFLDRIDVDGRDAPDFGFHPHSGIATLTLMLEGGAAYEDSTGAAGTMEAGSVEWMQAGGGVWHVGKGRGERIRGYQLWLALPPELENAPPVSRYLAGDRFPVVGPARVILGELGGARSPIRAPSPIDYLDVRLAAGHRWRYEPPPGHDVAWIAVHAGTMLTPDPVPAGELAVFEESTDAIVFEARGDVECVIGSATRHPHDLVLGRHSVHTTVAALARGEDGIRRIGDLLRRAGKL